MSAISDHSPVQINIYELDYALLKTPVPNKELYTKATRSRLLSAPFSDDLSWYWNGNILMQALTPFNGPKDAKYNPWNGSVVNMVKADMENPSTIPVLFCRRKDCPVMNQAITHILSVSSMHFDKIRIDCDDQSEIRFVDELLSEHPTCYEISLYASYSRSKEQLRLVEHMRTKHSEVDFFLQRCPCSYCCIDPKIELNCVSQMIHRYNNLSKRDPVSLETWDGGLALHLNTEEKLRLLRLAYGERSFMPHLEPLSFRHAGVVRICDKDSSFFVRKHFFKKIGQSVEIVAQQKGLVSKQVYAIKFTCKVPGLRFLYHQQPIVLICHRGNDSSLRQAVKSIRKWTPLEGPEKRVFHPRVGRYRRMDIVG